MIATILIVDDEARMTEVIALALQSQGYQTRTFVSARKALESARTDGADVVVTDWKMPEMDGMELMKQLHHHIPKLPVIMITAHADVPSAVTAMREGAFDYILKPFDNDELRNLVARALEVSRLKRENQYLRQEIASRYTPENVVAESTESKKVLDLIRRVAPSDASVLIQGASGTGKEMVARLLHYWSDRVGKPFVAVNCKAFATGVLESELFGHEQGAFTGAISSKKGCFERANGGTLFLDEIGEVDNDFQAKLLRVLQDKEVLRVGGGQPRKINVRVVAATNRKIQQEIAQGRFREDLFFRINVIPVQLSPLTERKEDILPLARYFLSKHTVELKRELRISDEAEKLLEAHPWTGNVRELQNVIERAVVLARTNVITSEDLLLESFESDPAAARPASSGGTLQEFLDQAARERIHAALQKHRGHRIDAADELGIDRTTLYRLMKRLKI